MRLVVEEGAIIQVPHKALDYLVDLAVEVVQQALALTQEVRGFLDKVIMVVLQHQQRQVMGLAVVEGLALSALLERELRVVQEVQALPLISLEQLHQAPMLLAHTQ